MSGGNITHVGVALTFGLVILAMIYAVGEISGAHFNPAVTTAFWLSGRFPIGSVIPYIVSQGSGAFAAAAFCGFYFQRIQRSEARCQPEQKCSHLFWMALPGIDSDVPSDVRDTTEEIKARQGRNAITSVTNTRRPKSRQDATVNERAALFNSKRWRAQAPCR